MYGPGCALWRIYHNVVNLVGLLEWSPNKNNGHWTIKESDFVVCYIFIKLKPVIAYQRWTFWSQVIDSFLKQSQILYSTFNKKRTSFIGDKIHLWSKDAYIIFANISFSLVFHQTLHSVVFCFILVIQYLNIALKVVILNAFLEALR